MLSSPTARRSIDVNCTSHWSRRAPGIIAWTVLASRCRPVSAPADMSPRQPSSFLVLPDEIRRRIFKHLHTVKRRLGAQLAPDIKPDPEFHFQTKQLSAQILRANSQVYHEGLPILSRHKLFRLFDGPGVAATSPKWMSENTPKASRCTYRKLEVGSYKLCSSLL